MPTQAVEFGNHADEISSRRGFSEDLTTSKAVEYMWSRGIFARCLLDAIAGCDMNKWQPHTTPDNWRPRANRSWWDHGAERLLAKATEVSYSASAAEGQMASSTGPQIPAITGTLFRTYFCLQ